MNLARCYGELNKPKAAQEKFQLAGTTFKALKTDEGNEYFVKCCFLSAMTHKKLNDFDKAR